MNSRSLARALDRSVALLVAIAAAGLAAGLLMSLADPSPLAERLLRAAIVVLMATPLARVGAAAAEAVASEDWPHLSTIAVVTLLLAATLAYAMAV